MIAAATGGLGAILINPPATSGGRTLRHLGAAGRALGHAHVVVANLCAMPTRDVNELERVATDPRIWHSARPELERVIMQSDVLIAGWGVKSWSGPSAVHFRDQLELRAGSGHEMPGKNEIWTLGGEPRHPSRWHQYVSERYGRATGETLAARLSSVLEAVPLDALSPSPGCHTCPHLRSLCPSKHRRSRPPDPVVPISRCLSAPSDKVGTEGSTRVRSGVNERGEGVSETPVDWIVHD